MTPTTEAFDALMPEPAYKVTSKMGEFICLRAKTYDNKKGDGLYTADQMREAIRAATERAAKQERKTRGYLGSTPDGGIDDHDEEDPNEIQPVEDYSRVAQDAGHDAGTTGAASGVGANQHHQYRTGQPDDQRTSAECDSSGTGVSGEGKVREAADYLTRIATLSGQRDVLRTLLRECLGPLEVSASIFESDDAEPLEELIHKVSSALNAFDTAAIRASGGKESAS